MTSKPTKPARAPTESESERAVKKEMPNPTPEQVDHDTLFNAIWQVIKSWDVNVPDYYSGYCGANGSHVMLILNAIKKEDVQLGQAVQPKPTRPATSDEMRLALSRLASVREHLTLLRDDDDPVAVLEGVIDELLHKRHAIADVQQWMQTWQAENVRR